MSKRSYEALAAALRRSKPIGDYPGGPVLLGQWLADVDAIATAFEQTVYRVKFDRVHFEAACKGAKS